MTHDLALDAGRQPAELDLKLLGEGSTPRHRSSLASPDNEGHDPHVGGLDGVTRGRVRIPRLVPEGFGESRCLDRRGLVRMRLDGDRVHLGGKAVTVWSGGFHTDPY